jgi:hypothetical protein
MPNQPMTTTELTTIALEVREAYQRAVADTREMAQRLDERSRQRAEAGVMALSARPTPRPVSDR